MNIRVILLGLIHVITGSAHATIIILKGTCCSGKTSISREVIKLDNTWKLVDEDTIYYVSTTPERWSRIFPDEYRVITRSISDENIFHAVVYNELLFKNSVSEDDKAAVYKAIKKIQIKLNTLDDATIESKQIWFKHVRSLAVSQIHDYSMMGNNVIVDSVFLKDKDVELLKKHFQVIIVLTYSPFEELVMRMKKRNAEATKTRNYATSKRFFYHLLTSFFVSFYDVVPQSYLSSDAIDILTIDSLNNAFSLIKTSKSESIHTAGSRNLFTRGEFNNEQLNAFIDEVTTKFAGNSSCYLIPKIAYDVFINTNNTTSRLAAKELVLY